MQFWIGLVIFIILSLILTGMITYLGNSHIGTNHEPGFGVVSIIAGLYYFNKERYQRR